MIESLHRQNPMNDLCQVIREKECARRIFSQVPRGAKVTAFVSGYIDLKSPRTWIFSGDFPQGIRPTAEELSSAAAYSIEGTVDNKPIMLKYAREIWGEEVKGYDCVCLCCSPSLQKINCE